MKNKLDFAYAAGFAVILCSLSFLLFVLPKSSFSDLENRPLQGKPKLTWEALRSKKFAEQTELFISDHFPFRNSWIAVKSESEQLRLQQENNGIYRGRDGYLFEKFDKPDEAALSRYADAAAKLAFNHPEANITFLLAPTSVGLYPEKLPWLAYSYPQQNVNRLIGQTAEKAGISFIDGFDFLRPAKVTEQADSSSRQLYYRTDHHWTTYGAYLAYQAYAEQMGWQPHAETDFSIRTVTDRFLGSFHTRSQFAGLKAEGIQVYEPAKPVVSEIRIEDDGSVMNGLYDESSLNKKDKYAYFLGGVHAVMTIHSKLAPGETDMKKLLVIKDSYAHSVLPFLTLHVPEIHVIDLRYYNGKISDYMAENEIGDVLLMFNTATFASTRDMLKLGY
ncbi:DHHW family protein [Paenibacillus sp. NPDC058071]|uniref:DHHW family protein n=1 Tax=Paenibacillus sp. NPDC058071 TaxID=3346326 RepID=UPI0036DAB709